jgi:inorganic pyrophosphatase
MLPSEIKLEFMRGHRYTVGYGRVFGCIMLGLWSGFFIGLQTEFLTSNQFGQPKELARACNFDAATNIIKGLALGYWTSILPIVFLVVTLCVTLYWAEIYGVALAALGMLGCLPVYLTILFFSTTIQTAKSLVQISKTGPETSDVIEKLNDAGITTTVWGKSLSNSIALLVSISLFGAYTHRVSELSTDATVPNILSPFTFSGLLFGAMLPYAFCAIVMTSINSVAENVIADIKEQIPKIKETKSADHKTFIDTLTSSSLKLVIVPAAIIILSPIIWGVLLGFRFVSGMIAGSIISGIQIGIANSNSGGAWCTT